MTVKPKCIIVTGRAGAGKSTLSRKLGERLWMPVISRDQLKEGYVNTFGVKHDQLPADTDLVVTNFFFDVVEQYLGHNVSVIIEAAFQHRVWEPRISKIGEIADLFLIICSVDVETAAKRHLQRGLENPEREIYHEDKRVSIYRATGEMGIPKPYEAPDLPVTTVHVSTEGEYSPTVDELVQMVRRPRSEGGT
jgi:predicted kinase